MVIMAPPRRHNQPDSSLLLSTLIQDTLCVRENVRLYNWAGFVTCLYFVFLFFIRRNYLGVYGYVTKRMWWMPWQLEAMKDVLICEKLWWGDKNRYSQRCPNGETHPS